jgi:hypothetical protein
MNKLSIRTKVVLTLILLFCTSYGYHFYNVTQVKKALDSAYKEELKKFESEKNMLYSKLINQDKNASRILDSLYSLTIENAKSFNNKTVSFLFFSENIKYNLIDFKYLNTLKIKVESELYNYYQLKKYRSGIAELSKIYGSATQEWEGKLDKEKFFEITTSDNCRPYFKNSDKYRLKDNAISEFNRFLADYTVHQKELQNQDIQIKGKLENQLNNISSSLNANAKRLLSESFDKSEAINSDYEFFKFKWAGEEDFAYEIAKKSIDQSYIDNTLEKVYTEQYRLNSLSNGSMPYSYCFGGSNSGSSSIKVNAGPEDVLVTVKNNRNVVVRHAYVKAYRTFRINVPNGSYQVFFYYGTGWNPKKFMKDTNCGRLVGGFVSNESVSRDPDILQLYNQELQYTLSKQTNGNFSTSGSSKFEAF